MSGVILAKWVFDDSLVDDGARALLSASQVDRRCEAFLSEESALFVARWPYLDLATQGRTLDEACRSLDDSAKSYINWCYRMGILGVVLHRASERQSSSRVAE